MSSHRSPQLNNLPPYQHWIFDLDGTITQPVHDFAAIRQRLSIPAGEDILQFIDHQDDLRKAEMTAILSEFEREAAMQAVANEGAVEFLHALKQRQCQLGILTRNQRDCVMIVLARLGIIDLFDEAAILAVEDAPAKPNPAGINRILNYWQADSETAVMVGDYAYDLQAGRAAGVYTIHYGADRSERWPELTDCLIHHFKELHGLKLY